VIRGGCLAAWHVALSLDGEHTFRRRGRRWYEGRMAAVCVRALVVFVLLLVATDCRTPAGQKLESRAVGISAPAPTVVVTASGAPSSTSSGGS
jgi:hypothetical protein